MATAIATFRAERDDAAPVTSMRTSFCAPSPSRTTCNARSSSRSSSLFAKSASARPPLAGTRGCWAWPVANSSTVSEVEVSESTVVRLKLASTPSRSSASSASAGILASVATKQSIVAMSGAIMPLPLAMPLMRTSAPSMRATRVAVLGNVSVVMMPRAASPQASSRSPAYRPGNAATSRSCGNTSPITPVEARKTCLGGQPTRSAAACAVATQATRPARPVKTLAFPALTTTARMPSSVQRSRHRSTGADWVPDAVNRAALVVAGGVDTSRPRSRSPLALIPHFTPAALKPRGRPPGSSVTLAGASTQREEKNGWVAVTRPPRAHET